MAEKCVCSVCGSSDAFSLSYTGSCYCQKHFRELVEKRVRKDLRVHQPLDVKKKYCLADATSVCGRLLQELLSSIFSDQLLYNDEGIVLNPLCLEQYSSLLFQAFLDKELDGIDGLFPLRTVSIEDINHLMKSDLKKADYTHPLLESLENVQPASLFSVLKTLEKEE